MKMKAMALAFASCVCGPATQGLATDVKVGIIVGFTGPGESHAPGMARSAELAFSEVNASGAFLDGAKVVPVAADSTCIDASAATSAAERLVSVDEVTAIMGADCSGVTTAILNNVAVPKGVVMVSPSATSPALTDIEDKGFFFRTAPSDVRQGQVFSDILTEKGIMRVAVTYTNNDYGKGLSDAFAQAFAASGGKITINLPHDDGKGDYSAEVGALSAAGGDLLVVFGYADQGGVGVIRAALDAAAFDRFALGDGMYADSVIARIGKDLDGSIGSLPWSEGTGADAFASVAQAGGLDPDGTFRRESYDAAALIVLAMQKAGSSDRLALKDNIFDIANAPGEKILPGQLGKALKIIKAGGEIDYVGATNVELIGPGEASGTYREYEIRNGKFETVGFR